MWLNQQQLKFLGTGASWKQLHKARIRSGFPLTQLQPHGLAQNTLAWKHRAKGAHSQPRVPLWDLTALLCIGQLNFNSWKNMGTNNEL